MSQYFNHRRETVEFCCGQHRTGGLSHALVHEYCSQISQYFKRGGHEIVEILLVASSGLGASVMLSVITTSLR